MGSGRGIGAVRPVRIHLPHGAGVVLFQVPIAAVRTVPHFQDSRTLGEGSESES